MCPVGLSFLEIGLLRSSLTDLAVKAVLQTSSARE